MVYLEPTSFTGELDVSLRHDLREKITSSENNIGNHQEPLSLFEKKKRPSTMDEKDVTLHLTSENFSDLAWIWNVHASTKANVFDDAAS